MKNLLIFKSSFCEKLKLIIVPLILLTLGVGQMWAMNVKKPKVYFNNQTPNWSTSNLYFAAGHDSYTRLYYTTTISNTKLQYVDLGNYDCSYCGCDCQQWGDANYVAFCRSTSAWDQSGSYGYSHISSNMSKYSGKKTSYDMNSGSTYYCTMANSSNGATLSVSYISGGYGSIQKYNATQSAKKRDTGTTYSTVSGSWPATLNLKGTYLSGDGASSQSTITSTASTDGDAKKVYGAVVTGEITHSYESLSSSYYFEGWGTGSTPSSTGSTYSYNISAATTVYAFFSKKYTLTYDKKGTSGSSSLSVSIADFSGTKTSGSSIPTGHTITFTASPATGYEVEGWYSDASCNTSLNNGTNSTYTISSLNANSSVYCKFQRKTTTVTLNLHDATSGDESVTATYDEVLPAFTLAEKTGGYNLTGYWTAASEGTKIINADGTLVRNTSYTSDEETPVWKSTSSTLTLHAQWNNFLTVTYDGNGNTGGDAPTDATEYDSGDEVTVASAPGGMVKTGYTFTGWNTAPGGGGTSYAAGATFNITANTTLYAQWSENMTTVNLIASPTGRGTFTVGGSTVTSTTAGVTTTRSVTAVPITGYYLTGTIWSKNNNNISLSTTTSATTTVTGGGTAGTSTDLTATFKEKYLLCGSVNAAGNPSGGMRGWSTTGNNDSYSSVTYSGSTITIQANLTQAGTQYKCMIRDVQNSAWKGQTSAGGSMSDGDTWTWNGTNDVLFTTTEAGIYTFTINISGASPSVQLTYPGETEYSATLSVHSSGHGSVSPAAGSIILHPYSTPLLRERCGSR